MTDFLLKVRNDSLMLQNILLKNHEEEEEEEMTLEEMEQFYPPEILEKMYKLKPIYEIKYKINATDLVEMIEICHFFQNRRIKDLLLIVYFGKKEKGHKRKELEEQKEEIYRNINYQVFLDECPELIIEKDIFISAIANNCLSLVQFFVENTSHCKSIDIGFQYACKYGHIEIVKYLISKKANFRINDNQGLIFACQKGFLEIVEYLVSLEFILDAFILGFKYACQYGYVKILKFFVSLNLDIHIYNFQEFLNFACQNGHLEVLEYLLFFINLETVNYSIDSLLATAFLKK
jgi:hypothetical protein